MSITKTQRIAIMQLWQRVCKDRGWKSSDRAFRLAKFSELVGRPLASSDDIERIDECTKLMKELTALLGVSLCAAQESDDLSINRARVLRNQIAGDLIPCLKLYVEDVPAYLTRIMEDKNRWWKIDRPARDITIMDLDAKPIVKVDKRTGEVKEFSSQLKQLQYTLTARISSLRNAAGDTIHAMKIKAHVPCHCAICEPRRPVALILPPVTEDVAEPNPF